MAKRKIIKIDENKCNGCGLCIPNCPEGAIQILDGKARLISDLFCDGLGACLGHCPEGAIEFEEREAAPYDEAVVMENIIKAGKETIIAHLKHLLDHNETEFFKTAVSVLRGKNIEVPREVFDKGDNMSSGCHSGGCPGSKTVDNRNKETSANIGDETGSRTSQLRQWPVQLHLVSPQAGYFNNADLLLAADCTAFSLGDFHRDFLKGKALAIACPKLDTNKEVYLEKLVSMIDNSKLNTITVMIMEVPCCGGLLQLAKEATERAGRKIPLKLIVVGIEGGILQEKWI